jgi:hypothetical protein
MSQGFLGMSQGFLEILVTNFSYFSRQYVRGSYNIIYFSSSITIELHFFYEHSFSFPSFWESEDARFLRIYIKTHQGFKSLYCRVVEPLALSWKSICYPFMPQQFMCEVWMAWIFIMISLSMAFYIFPILFFYILKCITFFCKFTSSDACNFRYNDSVRYV